MASIEDMNLIFLHSDIIDDPVLVFECYNIPHPIGKKIAFLSSRI